MKIDKKGQENILLGLLSVSNDIEQARQNIIQSIKGYLLSIDKSGITFESDRLFDENKEVYRVLEFGSDTVNFVYKGDVYSKRFNELSLGQLLEIFEYIKGCIFEEIE